MKLSLFLSISLGVLFLHTPVKADLETQSREECSALLRPAQAQRMEGTAIPYGSVTGWGAIFNGDVVRTSEGHLLGAFRMARRGYRKVSDDNVRGYRMVDYITDMGLFTSVDNGKSWKFEKMVFVAKHEIKTQIQYLEKLLKSPLEEATRDRTQRAYESIIEAEKNRIGDSDVLEDPRFISVVDSQGQTRVFLFVTSVPVELLIGGQDFADIKSYQMKALEIQFVRDSAFEKDHLTILNHQFFGPEENKDTWIINIQHNTHQQEQAKKLYAELGWEYKNEAHPVLLSTRFKGNVQTIPFTKLEDVFKVSPDQWKVIVSDPSLYETIMEPDGVEYQSLGNNDQPFAVEVSGYEKYFWHFYHKTKNDSTIAYSTWVELLNEHGEPVFRLPYNIQEPATENELQGDIDFVVFNSGHYRVTDSNGSIQLVHVNGVADSAVELSINNEELLLRELFKHPIKPQVQ